VLQVCSVWVRNWEEEEETGMIHPFYKTADARNSGFRNLASIIYLLICYFLLFQLA
jgi:hypothetical protein